MPPLRGLCLALPLSTPKPYGMGELLYNYCMAKGLEKYISKENQVVLVKRFKSFAWRTGGMALAAFLAFVSENIGLFDLPVWVVAIAGLVIGEITKTLNAN